MNEIGNKIREVRKKKGFSQEELAELSKVNLRTIQRLENNENEPRGKTLNLICEVLGVNAADILDYGKQPDKNYLVLFHLSVFAFFVIPAGNIVLPLILWMTKKDSIIGLKKVGEHLLNFQIIWSVVSFISVVIFALFKITHHKAYDVLLYLMIGLYASNIVLPIAFAIKTSRGKTQSLYPTLIRFIK